MPILGSRAAAAAKAFGQLVSTGLSTLRDALFSFDGMLLKGNSGDVLDTTKEQAPPSTIDYGSNNIALISGSTTKPSKFSPFTSGSYSTYFSSSYITTPSSTNTNIGTGDFTVEFWFYTTSVAGSYCTYWNLNQYTNGILYRQNTTGIEVYINNTQVFTPIGTVVPGRWYHTALVRFGTALNLYLNGVSIGATTNSASISPSSTMMIGSSAHATTEYFPGYISNLRFVVGTAIYKSNFTVPTSPLTAVAGTQLLMCQNAMSIENSNNNFALTNTGTPTITQHNPFQIASTYDFYGSQYFNGSTDYVVVPYAAGVDVLSTDFTIEAWIYSSSTGANQTILGQWNQTASYAGFLLLVAGSNITFYFGAYSEGTQLISSASTIKLNTWYHVAVVRSGSTFTMFINGSSTLGGTGTSAATRASLTTVNLSVGNYYSSGGTIGASGATYFSGYISNLRVIKGSALYTTTFIPSTAPLTATASTQLLTFQYNGAFNNNSIVDKSNYNAVITRTGAMTAGTMSPYTGIYSLSVGGGNWLYTPSNPILNFGTNDFTVEYWVYITGFGNGYCGWCMWDNGGSSARFTLGVQSTGAGSDSGYGMAFSPTAVNTVTVNLNTWTHIAITRKGSDWRWYTGGVNNQFATSSATFSPASVQTSIGNYNSSYATGTGYISNLRVVNGTALYTGSTTFTPSAIPLGIVPNTVLLMGSHGTFTDKARNLPISVTGTPSTVKMSPFAPSLYTQNQGSYSVYSNGTNTNLLVPYHKSLALTGDFTIELWYYPMAAAGMPLCFGGGSGIAWASYEINVDGSYNIYFCASSANTSYDIGAEVGAAGKIGTLTPNTWHHVAITRTGNNYRGFLNGVQGYNQTIALTPFDPGARGLAIGSNYSTTWGAAANLSNSCNGYISNVRIINGTSLYTSGFSPSTSPLTAVAGTVLLACQNTTAIDSSANSLLVYQGGAGYAYSAPFSPFPTSPITVTGGTITSPNTSSGSVIINSAADYGMIPHHTVYDFSTGGSWSFEAWVYTTGSSSLYRTIIAKRNAVSSWEFYVAQTTNYFGFYNGTQYLTSTPILNNIWYHLAACYDGTTMRLFVNGSQGYSGAVNAVTGTDNVYIGGAYYTSAMNESFIGYISDLRIVRGKALYTSNFIPPSSPISATNETLLLLNGSSGGAIFDNAGCNDFQTVNSATISTSIKKYGTGSIKLSSATSDYLYLAGNNILNTGTADWTVEAWVYLASMPTSDTWPTNYTNTFVLFCTGTPAAADGTNCIIGATKLMLQINDTAYISTSSHNMVINTWYYVTYVRYNSTITFYVNGTSLGSVAGIPTNGTGSGTYIGCETTNGAFFNGYIDELRFSRLARYITPYFPAPTQTDQEAGPSLTDPGQFGVSAFVAGDGLTSSTAGISAAAIKAQTGTNIDGIYWINLPTVGPTPVYCLMNSAAAGGGWMMAMKATAGTTFVFTSTHWTTVTTLNPTDTTRSNADAKFNTMNYFAANDIMALWPDIATNGGSLGTNPYSCWSWQENNFNGSATTLINFFNTAGTYNTGNVNTAGNYGGKFIKDAKTFSGWASGIFSSQVDVRFYGFNYKNGGLSYGGNGFCRWGFAWNENGEGLYSTYATLATGAATGSNDVWGGIGLGSDGGSYSAGDKISCCNDTTGINRSARVEIYIR